MDYRIPNAHLKLDLAHPLAGYLLNCADTTQSLWMGDHWEIIASFHLDEPQVERLRELAQPGEAPSYAAHLEALAVM